MVIFLDHIYWSNCLQVTGEQRQMGYDGNSSVILLHHVNLFVVVMRNVFVGLQIGMLERLIH